MLDAGGRSQGQDSECRVRVRGIRMYETKAGLSCHDLSLALCGREICYERVLVI